MWNDEMRSGWVRVGIVLSFIWCVSTFAYGWLEKAGSNSYVAQRHMDMTVEQCVKARGQTDCFAEGRRVYEQMMNGQGDPITVGAVFAAISLVPLFFLWLISMAAPWAIRWCLKGSFRL